MLSFKIPSKFRRPPAITKNRYEILFFYENPSLLINKNINAKLNNQEKRLNNQGLNNQGKNLTNQNREIESTIESTIEDLSTSVDFTKSIKEILNKSNNQKKTVNIKSISNISYLNNYNIYSKLACSKFYFYYRDDNSLNKRLSGQKPFDYEYEGQNSFFKRVLTYLSKNISKFAKFFNSLITGKDIESLNKNVNILKNILNNNISEIKNLPKNVNDLKKNIINNIREKYKEYEEKSDEDITKIMLEKINKMGIINKDFIIKKARSNLNKTSLDLTEKDVEEIKNILKLKEPDILKNFKNKNSKKKKYFENNIKKAFDQIRITNPNIKYCLVIDIKKSGPFKLNSVDKEYNIQEGGNWVKFIIIIVIFIIKLPFNMVITVVDMATLHLFQDYFFELNKWVMDL
jgi:hypothetical protein